MLTILRELKLRRKDGRGIKEKAQSVYPGQSIIIKHRP